ncbi:MAG: porin [Alphaproteobacteria bacterium]|nr:porin [Alphaproteobacteria bacterium]
MHMKTAIKYAVTALMISASSTAVLAEEKTRFESNGFLQSLDLFIAEQMTKLRGDHKPSKADSIKDLELSLRDKTESEENGFFYLREAGPASAGSIGSLNERPDFSSLLSPDGTVRGSYGQDLFGTGGRVGLSFGADKHDPTDRGFEIALQSAYRLSMQGLPAANAFNNSDLAERQYNVGLSVGYSGFNVDASLMRQTSVFESDMSGFDVGFSYQANSWSARLSMSEYREGADLYGIENEARNIISVELGASYRLTNTLGLQGGVRYYDYSNRLMLNPEAGEKSQMIFLGGRLKF